MDRLDTLLERARINELLGKKEEPKKSGCNAVVCIFTVIGVLVALAAIGYFLYKKFAPCYEECLDDDFDDFDDEEDDEDIYEDESIPVTNI